MLMTYFRNVIEIQLGRKNKRPFVDYTIEKLKEN
jgi:hypothetical protein